jgi:hypothetical protein
MTSITTDQDFNREITCTYKDERYSVRDNGAVLRHPRENGKVRPTDNQWIFGKPNEKTGYMEIASARVHRIVALAFHGEPPTKEHVVDHIDTNKRNNRPENLRWVTRLENVMLNPITAKRIAYVCGSVENFLANPEKYRDQFPEPNLSWMQAVTVEEAKISLERMLAWAKSDKKSTGASLDKWIFSREIVQTSPDIQPNYIMSKTSYAAQRIVTPDDKPNEYPSTPQAFEGDPLTTYYESLNEGAVFFRNHNGEYVVKKSGFSKDRHTLYVITMSSYVWREREDGEYIPVPIAELTDKVSYRDLPHSLTRITYEDGLFVHEKVELGFHPTEELEELFANYTEGEVCSDRYSGDYAEVREKEFKKRFELTPQNFIQKNWGTQSEFPCCPQKVFNNPIAEYAAQIVDSTIFFQNSYYFTTVIQSAIIDEGKSLLVLYEITKKESIDKRWGIMKIAFENEKFAHEIIPNYNNTLEHYWLIDVENHYKSIVEGSEWFPLYDSQGREFKGDYMPL